MSNEKLVCPICGEPTRVYMGNARKDRLCGKHADEYKIGKIIQCEKCGKWRNTDEKCSCEEKEKYEELPTEGFNKCVICGESTNGFAFCKLCWKDYSKDELLDILNGKLIPEKKKENVEVFVEEKTEKDNDDYCDTIAAIVIDENNKSKCITCGKESDGLLFCPSCFHRYKNKELLFRITKCSSVELLDADYEGRYTCRDGHIVKSKSERDIDNYLFEKGIQHAYEKEVYYGADSKDVLHPDFCLPNYLGKDKDVYIEHWGYNESNIQYTKTKKFKMPIYEKLCEDKKMTLICTYENKDTGKIDTVLNRKLDKEFIKENKINFEE